MGTVCKLFNKHFLYVKTVDQYTKAMCCILQVLFSADLKKFQNVQQEVQTSPQKVSHTLEEL